MSRRIYDLTDQTIEKLRSDKAALLAALEDLLGHPSIHVMGRPDAVSRAAAAIRQAKGESA